MALTEVAMVHTDWQVEVQQVLLRVSVLVTFPKEALQYSAEVPSVAVVPCEEARFEVVPSLERSALALLVVEGSGSQAFSNLASSSAPSPMVDRMAIHILS